MSLSALQGKKQKRKKQIIQDDSRLDGRLDWAYLEPVWLRWKHHGAPAVF